MIKYFSVTSVNRKEFWKNVFRLGKSEGMVDQWRRALMIIEICLIAPHSNAALERFFSILKLVKTLIRSRLDSDILNALMRIKMSCLSLEDFSHEHCKACVDKWYASKNRRINQKKRKRRKRDKKPTTAPISDLSSSYESEDSDSASDDE